jgi:hypothetical protein
MSKDIKTPTFSIYAKHEKKQKKPLFDGTKYIRRTAAICSMIRNFELEETQATINPYNTSPGGSRRGFTIAGRSDAAGRFYIQLYSPRGAVFFYHAAAKFRVCGLLTWGGYKYTRKHLCAV